MTKLLPQSPCNDLFQAAPRKAEPSLSGTLVALIDSRLERLVDRLFVWQQRMTDRNALASLDDHMLQDIGLSRADVEGEAGKPFWRA